MYNFDQHVSLGIISFCVIYNSDADTPGTYVIWEITAKKLPFKMVCSLVGQQLSATNFLNKAFFGVHGPVYI